ncbi:hypothetical protein GGR53DRAFT_510861 [Hypoxylon sp. FL1150]|nr:hypothetical protein GGR53DRAFT_510861 [Hypoxylon sp. FL1150]
MFSTLSNSRSTALYLDPYSMYGTDWTYDPFTGENFFMRLSNWRSPSDRSRWAFFFQCVDYTHSRINAHDREGMQDTNTMASSSITPPGSPTPKPRSSRTPGHPNYGKWKNSENGGYLISGMHPHSKLTSTYTPLVTPQYSIAGSKVGSGPDSPTKTDSGKLDDKPVLTWDPTIWSPQDPDRFHAPGLKGVVEKREYWGGLTIPTEGAQLVRRSTYPWWYRLYVRRVYGGDECLSDTEYLHRIYAVGISGTIMPFYGYNPAVKRVPGQDVYHSDSW